MDRRKHKYKVLFLFILFFFILPLINSNNLIITAKAKNHIGFSDENIQINPIEDEKTQKKPFIYTLNGRKYLAEYITHDKVEEMKQKNGIRDPNKNYNIIIDGHGTGYSPPSEKEYENLIGKISILKALDVPVRTSNWKATQDISDDTWFPIVGDQGFQGSCTAWANVYYAFGYMEAYDYNWDASSGNTDYLLSPAFAYNKLAAFDYGSMPVECGELLKELGTSTLTTMPYNDGDVDSWGSEAAWREAPYHRISDYTLITYTGDPTITVIKSFLDSGTPVTFGIDANNFYSGLDDTLGDYILNSSEYDPSWGLNHAQCIVGYDDAIVDGSDIGAFKVVNSWGSDWMDNGFYWLTYDAFKEFAGVFNQYILYYTDLEDYEPSLIATWEFSSAPTRMDDIITLSVGPYGAALDTKTFQYDEDLNNLFPDFMALDITEFQSFYDANNEVSFFLEIGPSDTTGTISSFRVERYVSGSFEEITPESPDVPQSTPGYAGCFFMELEHEIKVLLELPTKPYFDNSYTVNATVINNGIYIETNVELRLYLDDVEINSATFPSLSPGAKGTIDFIWTITKYQTHNFTAIAPPVTSETYIQNNRKTQFISVRLLRNYTMTTGYPYTWIDATIGGYPIPLGDDDYFGIGLPFDFEFYDTIYSELFISSNGYLSFTDPTPIDLENDPLPSANPEHTYLIAPFWDNLDPNYEFNIFLATDINTFLVIEWVNISHYNGEEVGTFEIILYNTGEIIFSYDEINYIDPYDGYTCGLNYGDMLHYNSYQGLDTSTSLFSIHFELELLPGIDLTDRGTSFSNFTPITVEAGVTSFDVWCDVENRGSIISEPFEVSYYASSDTTITESDYLLGTDTVSSIAPGYYADSSLSGIFPSVISNGIYYVGWIIDSNDDVDEIIEINNVFYETSEILFVGSINILFQEDFEGGLSKWVDIDGLWHLTDTGSSWPDPCHSPTHSIWFGNETTGNYDTGYREYGNITSIPIDLSQQNKAYLQFYHWRESERGWDYSYLLISTDGFGTSDLIYSSDANIDPWQKITLDITDYCGYNSVQLMFYFDTLDEIINDYRGWLIDDIQIVAESNLDLTDRGLDYSGFTPITVEPGLSNFNVWCDIQNTGSGSSGSFTVSYYASIDSTIDTSDYLIGTDTVSSIASGDYEDSSWSGIFPKDIPNGFYYIGWIIDSGDEVDETDENNNIFYETSILLVSNYTLDVNVGDKIIYALEYFNGTAADLCYGKGTNPEAYFGAGALIGAYQLFLIAEIEDLWDNWNITLDEWNWTTDLSSFNGISDDSFNISAFRLPEILNTNVNITSLFYVIPILVESYLNEIDWNSGVVLNGRSVSQLLTPDMVDDLLMNIYLNYTFNLNGVLERIIVTDEFGEILWIINATFKKSPESNPSIPTGDDGGKGSKSKTNELNLIVVFTTVGIVTSTGIVSIVSIIYLKKTKQRRARKKLENIFEKD